jgi:hypothetical protein
VGSTDKKVRAGPWPHRHNQSWMNRGTFHNQVNNNVSSLDNDHPESSLLLASWHVGCFEPSRSLPSTGQMLSASVGAVAMADVKLGARLFHSHVYPGQFHSTLKQATNAEVYFENTVKLASPSRCVRRSPFVTVGRLGKWAYTLLY